MPSINVKLSFKVTDNQKSALLSKLAEAASKATGKPQSYIMTIIEDNVTMSLGGDNDHCAFIDYRQIGAVNGNSNKKASKALTQVLENELKINPQKVYITFTGFNGNCWGCDGDVY